MLKHLSMLPFGLRLGERRIGGDNPAAAEPVLQATERDKFLRAAR
jgi:hypothetical protein